MSLTVALEALEHDAGMWEDVSSVLSAASSSARSFTLSTTSLSWAAEFVGLVEVYETARDRVERLCGEGATETSVIASTLRQVSAVFESTDVTQQAGYDGMWAPN